MEVKNSNGCEMATKIEIKEEESHIVSQNEREFFVTMKRNIKTAAIKTEIKSETPFTKHRHVKQIKSETEIEEQTLISNFGSQNKEESLSEDSVMKDKKYNFDDEMEYKIEIKEEPLWLETEVYDIKDGDFPLVKSSRLCSATVPGVCCHISPSSSPETSGTHTCLYNVKAHHQCVNQKSDAMKMATAEEHVLSEECVNCSDGGQMDISSLVLKHKGLIHKATKAYKCQTCDKSFTRMSHLKTHNLIHEGRKPHQCKFCGKSFTQLAHLKRHSLIHEGKKPHQCKICDKSFAQLSHLKTHNLIHEGKKSHRCKTCDKCFTQLGDLKRHNLIHEGRKPFQCKACDKRFTRMSDLKTHNMVHEGKKPYQCKACHKNFTQLSKLKTHIKTHDDKKLHEYKT